LTAVKWHSHSSTGFLPVADTQEGLSTLRCPLIAMSPSESSRAAHRSVSPSPAFQTRYPQDLSNSHRSPKLVMTSSPEPSSSSPRPGPASRLMLSVKRTLSSSNGSRKRPPDYQVRLICLCTLVYRSSSPLRPQGCCRLSRNRVRHHLYISLETQIQWHHVPPSSRLLWVCMYQGHLTCGPLGHHLMRFLKETLCRSHRDPMIIIASCPHLLRVPP
jgi:hypothetical protein